MQFVLKYRMSDVIVRFQVCLEEEETRVLLSFDSKILHQYLFYYF